MKEKAMPRQLHFIPRSNQSFKKISFFFIPKQRINLNYTLKRCMRGVVMRCVWIFICWFWFHPVAQIDEWTYFFAWIGGSWSFMVMESRRMLGLSYSSILIPALKNGSDKKRENKKEERERENRVHHCASCKGIFSLTLNVQVEVGKPPLRFTIEENLESKVSVVHNQIWS